jgi:hypothetical protein
MTEHQNLFPAGDDRSRSMRDPDVRQRRRAMLDLPHIKDLTAYVARLRTSGLGEVPDFDPFDGGVEARVLFLFEKPGPMTAPAGRLRRLGSGFISRNNDDPTAQHTLAFMQQADIPRKLTVIWNVVPWWNSTREVSEQELRRGTDCVKELVSWLPRLCAVVMVGEKAARAKPYLETTTLTLFTSSHPSPLVRARFRDKWDKIPSQWAKVMTVCKSD